MPAAILTRQQTDTTPDADSVPLLLPGPEGGAELMLLDAALVESERRYEQLAERFGALLTAAQAVVIEARTGRRNPITPLIEALSALGQLPEPGVRLADVVVESVAAWPRGVAG
jgi:hypothetical protein